jgi:phosphoribosylamine--glycine ligase
MKILVIGSGGRDHALVWKISQSKKVKEIFAVPGNGGMKELAKTIDIKASNIIEIADFAQEEKIDLTVVGPELPLSLGIVDEFQKRNLKIFGPTQKAAMIESSKIFAKEFMRDNKIPTPDFHTYNYPSDARDSLKKANFPVVVKADGLAGGKGVFICNSLEQAESCIHSIMVDKKFGKAGERILIEEYEKGQEMSFMVISDGKRALPLVSAMDYKKIFDNDRGPNTGGMGAISPAPQTDKNLYTVIMKSVIQPTINGLRQTGKEFRGILYAGLMITPEGPKVLEFNVRFGDPETQAVILRMKSDIVELLEGAAEGTLFDIPVEWDQKVSGCVVLTSKGYPSKYETQKRIEGLERAKSLGVEIFHAGTDLKEKKLYSTGGRVLNICAKSSTLKEAMKKIYDAISFITYDNIYYRTDIGKVKK